MGVEEYANGGAPHRRCSIDVEKRKASSTVGSSQPNMHLPYHPNQNNHNSFSTTTCLLYIIFIILLFLSISLQILMAQIYMNETMPPSNVLLHNMTMVAANSHNEHELSSSSYVGQYISPFYTSIVDRIHDGLYIILSTIFHVYSNNNNDTGNNIVITTAAADDNKQKNDEDYVFIFYLLLSINIITMLPSTCKRLLLSTRNPHTNHRVANDDNHQKTLSSSTIEKEKHAQIHNKLLQTYLPAYLLATCADWLQGPYKYALYSSYGYTQRDIAHLFVAGYGSGMILGSIVGGLADAYGRKRLCLCYCLAYTFSVLMKHCKHFYVLLVGRVGGGIATSLLFSVFESWLIGAHTERGLGSKGGLKKDEEEKWLAKSLSLSMYGSSLVAIGSGVLANIVVANSGKMRPLHGDESSSIYYGGYISAFDICLVPLVLCATCIVVLWEENYGADALEVEIREYSGDGLTKKHSVTLEDVESINLQNEDGKTILDVKSISQRKGGACSTLLHGCRTVWNSPNILACCIIGSVYEGAMYIFIFLWTPALSVLSTTLDKTATAEESAAEKDPHTDSELPFGVIFSSFMVCCMLGTTAFSRLSTAGVSASMCLAGILALSSISCLAMATPVGIGASSSSANTPQYIGMLLYEFCIGFYYPAMGTVKGTIVPEDQRAAIYNVFRLPLNLLVLIYLIGDFSTEVSFLANALLLMGACILQLRLVRAHGVAHGREGHQHDK